MNEKTTASADKKIEINSDNHISLPQKSDASQFFGSPVDRIMFLQRTIGNHAIARLIESGALQAKFRIGQPGDEYEQEADRVADQMMRMPEPCAKEGKNCSRQTTYIQRKCSKCEEDEEIQRKTEEDLSQAQRYLGSTHEATPEFEANINTLSGRGEPLPESMRAFFEPRFGYNFSHVRLCMDGSADAIGALAYTIGDHIVFGKSQYSPNTIDGKRLLAHELAHVIQQRFAQPIAQFKSFGEHDDPLEVEADRISESVLEGHQANVGLIAPPKKPQFGIIGCMWYMWRFSKLLDECRNEYDKACGEDMISDKCLEYMDNIGAGNPSDAILKCVGRKNPKAMAKLLSSCITVSLGQIFKGPRASIEKPSGPPPEEVDEDKKPETSVA